MTQLNFDASTVAPSTGTPDPVPSGWYPVIIAQSGQKPTSNGDGMMLELEMTIIDGEYKGRKLFDRLNLKNKSEMAMQIAYETLSAICHATNVIQVKDSQQLHNIPLEVKAKLVPPEGNYDAKNDVKGYRKLQGAAAQPEAQGGFGDQAGFGDQSKPAEQAGAGGGFGDGSSFTPPEQAGAGAGDGKPPWATE